jgi:hypothetical protein
MVCDNIADTKNLIPAVTKNVFLLWYTYMPGDGSHVCFSVEETAHDSIRRTIGPVIIRAQNADRNVVELCA